MLRSLLFQWLSQRWGTQSRGDAGERLAERFLIKNHQFRLVARNWRNPRDRREEVDLVMRDGEILVFVEVKTRSAQALVSGFHAVNKRKKKVLRRAIAAYLRGMAQPPLTHRCDVVEVSWPTAAAGGRPEVRHFANVALKRRT
jgi:putative endonuclease